MQILSRGPRGLTDGPQWSKEVQGCYGKPSGGQALSGPLQRKRNIWKGGAWQAPDGRGFILSDTPPVISE